MPKPYSLDLRERVFRYVDEGHSCHRAAGTRTKASWIGAWGTVTLSLNGRCRTADRDQKVMRKGLHLSRCSKRSTLRFVHDAFHLQTVDPGDDETGWRSDRGWREISEHAALF